jgi:YhcH/YjgK/YiaL family protein
MIFDNIANADRYAPLHPLFPRAFDFIRTNNLLELASGCHPISGDELLVIIENVAGRSRTEAKLECHRKYIDIQFVLAGIDEMGWKPLAECRDPIEDYSAERDVQFFFDTPSSWIATPPGAFCIFFPEDAHAPLVATCKIRKAIFKIAARTG